VAENMKSDIFKNLTTEFASTYEQVGKLYNLPAGQMNFQKLDYLMDVAMADYFENNKMTIEYGSDLWKNVTFLREIKGMAEHLLTEENKKLYATPLFNEFIQVLDGKTGKGLPEKYFVYSAHDTTLMPLLTIFNISSVECVFNDFFAGTSKCPRHPPFSSTYILELYSDDSTPKNYHVKMSYNDVNYSPCSDGSMTCDYKKFKSHLQSLSVEDYMVTCGNNVIPGPPSPPEDTPMTHYFLIALIAVVALLLAVIFVLSRKLYHNHKDSQKSMQIYEKL